MKEKQLSLSVHPLIKCSIRDSILKALQSKPVVVHLSGTTGPHFPFYEIDGEVYSDSSAVEKILGQYSWWKD